MPTIVVPTPPTEAETLARCLVEDRLAAAVNRVPCRSTYRWDGEVIEAEEELLFLRTTDHNVGPLIDRIEAEHPYDVPCIERFDEDELIDAAERWRTETTL